MDHNKNRREGLALLGIGVLITALALRPPRLLCRLYLALEQALAVFLGRIADAGRPGRAAGGIRPCFGQKGARLHHRI